MDSDIWLDRRGGENGQVPAIFNCSNKMTRNSGKTIPFFCRDAAGQSRSQLLSQRAVSSSPHPQRAAHSP